MNRKHSSDDMPGSNHVDRLHRALDQFDYELATRICDELVALLRHGRALLAPKAAKNFLAQLRRKRRFADLARVAEALLASGNDANIIKRQYAQALIDEGKIHRGLALVEEVARNPTDSDDLSEAEGLIGRGNKDLFVAHGNVEHFRRALDAYGQPWKRDHAQHLWHGVNLLALTAYARRHGVTVPSLIDEYAIADELLNNVALLKRQGKDQHWDHATAMEACIGLGRYDEAIRWARSYVAFKSADAFELGSTLRQLKELWELDKRTPPGNLLLPLLEAELLVRHGGEVSLDVIDLDYAEVDRLAADGTLEKVFGRDSYVTWEWYRLGQERCRSVARIESLTRQGYGTGFLVDGGSMNRRWDGEMLLLTNAHVVSHDGGSDSLRPEQAVACFETEGDLRVKVVELLDSSPVGELDFSLLRLEKPIAHAELAGISSVEPGPPGEQRLYAIGYPLGGTLSVSLRDNLLIEFDSPLLHYRTPTDPGSSGSPIFDDHWQLVALHHSGSRELPKLKGPGTHEANEGIWIQAVRDRLDGEQPSGLSGPRPTSPGPTPSRSALPRSTSTPATSDAARTTYFQSTRTAPPTSQGSAMNNPQQESLVRKHLLDIAAQGDAAERIRDELPRSFSAKESMATPSRRAPSILDAQRGLENAQAGRPLSAAEQFAIEAIVLPKERPVTFVRNNTFEIPASPWEHFAQPSIRTNIESAIPSVGRVELPSNRRIPYGGTAFVVGPNLLMTNRHVAQLFAQGVGNQISFSPGETAGWDYVREDLNGQPQPEQTNTMLTVNKIVMVHPYWDMALLNVTGLPAAQRPLVLSTASPNGLVGQDIAVIGYPARDDRNDLELQDEIFQRVYNVKRLHPGKLQMRGSIRSFGKNVSAVTHDSSTLGGNSGSVVLHAQTGAAVALHFAGIYLEANYAVPTYELARDPHVRAAGVNFDGSFDVEDPLVKQAWASIGPQSEIRADISASHAESVTVSVGAARFVVPVETATASSVEQAAFDATEGMKTPFVAPRLEEREGYDPKFLDLDKGKVPLPTLTTDGEQLVARLEDDTFELKYHKFSVCMHKVRRLALFTAANVDWRRNKRLVNGRKPTRRELNDFSSKSSERWVTDERIPQTHQLPDVFFTKDGGAFDKGHLVRRDDVTWGSSFKDMQKSNGDTFHTTNCSPQTSEFNQSSRGEDNWGDLENLIQRESDTERAIVLSGPVLSEDDLTFEGRDLRGTVLVQIPSRYWKIVVVKGRDGKPEAYGFLLEQDLADVPLEFSVPDNWRSKMVRIEEIESLLFGAATLEWYKDVDQFDEVNGDRERRRRRR